MKQILPIIFLFVFFSKNNSNAQIFYKGGDLSYVKELQDCGVQWKEDNVVKDIFDIFKDNGANIVRFRIWHTPTNGKGGFSYTDSLITRAKAKGFKVLLAFHYSDTWADAGHQKCPVAWSGVVNNFTTLADSLYNYTKKTLQALKDQGIMPEFVQVGNETNGGMCFPGDGVVTWPTDWSKQTLLFNAGIKAVRDVDSSMKVVLHVAEPKNVEWWAGQLNSNNVTGYDILGVSYYPLWHTAKSINDFSTIITNIKSTYHKDVMVVETGLSWTNLWDDNTTNIMNGVPSGYGSSPSPEIQAKWLIDLCNKVTTVGGLGVIYWEPAWVASHVAGCPSDFAGSTWENVALFDFDNNLMKNGGIRFCQPLASSNQTVNQSYEGSLNIFPNPVNTELNICFDAKSASDAMMEIIDMQGRTIATFTEKVRVGSNNFLLYISKLPMIKGFYMIKITAGNGFYKQRFVLKQDC